VDEILRLDKEYRSSLSMVEAAKAEKNKLSGEIGKAADKAAAARELKPRLDALAADIALLEEKAQALAPDVEGSPLRALLVGTQNILDDSVPPGKDAEENVLLREWGTPH